MTQGPQPPAGYSWHAPPYLLDHRLALPVSVDGPPPSCPHCGGEVRTRDRRAKHLVDMPYAGAPVLLRVSVRRFRCLSCGRDCTEVPPDSAPGFRATTRAVALARAWWREHIAPVEIARRLGVSLRTLGLMTKGLTRRP